MATVLCASRAALAQQLAGSVRDEATGGPVIGAVITLVDGSDRPGRALTGRDGEFRIRVTDAVRSIQVRRIGYRPVDLPLPDSARAGSAHLAITLRPIAELLAPVITQAALCPRSATAGRAGAFWEQAQSGFLAAVAAREANPAQIAAFRYHQQWTAGQIVEQTVRRLETESVGSFFASRAPAQMAERGYADVIGGKLSLLGPDTDILMDRSFYDTHCFELATSDPKRREQIGVRFSPAPGRDSLIDVSGVVWLDREPLALRSVEFRYEGLGSRSTSGGHVEFRTMENGVTLIDRWELRLEIGLQLRPGVTPTTVITRRMIVSNPVSGNRTAEGGMLRAASWRDGTSFQRPLASITGRVVDAAGLPAAGARVEIPMTPYRAVANDSGAFVIDDVVAGSYRLVAVDTTWSEFMQARFATSQLAVDEARRHTATLTLRPRPPLPLYRCTGAPFSPAPTVVVVQVVDASTRPRPVQAHLTVSVDPASAPTIERAVETSDDGVAILCGVPFGGITVSAIAAQGLARASNVKVTSPARVMVNLVIRR